MNTLAMRLRIRLWLRLARLLAGLALACATGCAATPRLAAHVSITTAGDVVAELERASERAYVQAAAALRARLAEQHASADYPQAVVPLDALYDARTAAIAAASDALYAAAALNDMGDQAPPAQRRAAAARAAQALESAVLVLNDGDLMPPLPIPPAMRAAVTALRQMAGPVPAALDGGSP